MAVSAFPLLKEDDLLSIPFNLDNKNKVFYLSCQALFSIYKKLIVTIWFQIEYYLRKNYVVFDLSQKCLIPILAIN